MVGFRDGESSGLFFRVPVWDISLALVYTPNTTDQRLLMYLPRDRPKGNTTRIMAMAGVSAGKACVMILD